MRWWFSRSAKKQDFDSEELFADSLADKVAERIRGETHEIRQQILALTNLNQATKASTQSEEERLETIRQALKEALRQQLGTSEPAEIKRALDMIIQKVSSKPSDGSRNDEIMPMLGRLQEQVSQFAEIRNVVVEFQRLQEQADEARRVIAEKEGFIAERERFSSDQAEAKNREEDAKRSKHIAELSHENALRDGKRAQELLAEVEDRRLKLVAAEGDLTRRELTLLPKEKALQQKEAALGRTIRAILSKKAQLSSERREWEMAYVEKKAEVDLRLKEAEDARRQAVEKHNETVALNQEIQILLRRAWPDFMLSAEWELWRSTLQKEAAADTDAAGLLAAIHLFAAAFRGQDREFLLDALRQIGLIYYRWLRKKLFDESLVYDQVALLAKGLNEHADKRFRLEVAKPGQPTIAQWMNFKSGLNTVGTVTNWAVYDSMDPLPHHKAIVQAI